MKTLTNIIVTFTFAFGCFTLWAMLRSLDHLSPSSLPLPALTSLFVHERSVLLLLPFLIAGWCIYSCFRRPQTEQFDVIFVAWTLSGLFLVSFPVLMVVFLPYLVMLDRMK